MSGYRSGRPLRHIKRTRHAFLLRPDTLHRAQKSENLGANLGCMGQLQSWYPLSMQLPNADEEPNWNEKKMLKKGIYDVCLLVHCGDCRCLCPIHYL